MGTTNFTTRSSKESFTESNGGTFAVSEVSPMPADREAQFSIETSEAGHLNVSIYNLAGSLVRSAVTNMYLNENTEITIPLDLEDLASGHYTVEISVNNDRVLRSVVINK